MNRRQFFIALAVLAILAAAGAAVVLSDRSAWTAADSRAGQKAIPGLRLSEVAELAIRDSSGELHLVRGETGWSVRERAGFAADTDRIAALLVKLAELKIVQSEPLPESQRARLELLEPKDKLAGAGTAIELKDAKGGTLGQLLLGKKIVKSSPVASLSHGEAVTLGIHFAARLSVRLGLLPRGLGAPVRLALPLGHKSAQLRRLLVGEAHALSLLHELAEPAALGGGGFLEGLHSLGLVTPLYRLRYAPHVPRRAGGLEGLVRLGDPLRRLVGEPRLDPLVHIRHPVRLIATLLAHVSAPMEGFRRRLPIPRPPRIPDRGVRR